MNRKYKMNNHDRVYFVSFATDYWVDFLFEKLFSS
ncbi:Uncharacterised protein [Canicola haemoglobinophilus]|uniref:Uncharacterized protein n=1 Tax=Canicola haemoglobinophilus TaxID=733 RepID=A0A377HUN1_9PAST|nr:Uncharacterised protein [Canicola haemoglobinophilus]STO59907.1 Uncharacterised protein [Canicola haemoglobinophilus]STO67605.1 Uncharacterised protein [Canicola haemoglobinophilus]